jgi:putative FmdB family regulatory protein
MPIYEYRCEACRARLSGLARTIDAPSPRCTACGGARVTRLRSRFAAPRSEEAPIEALSDPSGLGDGDPRAEAFPGATDSGASDE